VIVIGAGAFGGWTALHLQQMGASVVLIDSSGPGNLLASSGGKTRVIRAIYGPDRIYVEMVKRAFDLWEDLDAATEERLYVPTGALWMHRGDDAYVRSSLPILRELGFPVDSLAVDEAKRRYPQINFAGVKSLWFEQRAGALMARRACMVVRDAFTKAGGTYRTAEVKPSDIGKGDLAADAHVFACGPWLGKLFPDVLGSAIRPTRQEVYYFKASDRYAANRLPIWIDFGERIVYGIPDAEGRWFKVADDTRGDVVDPGTANRTRTEKSVARARRFLAERFPGLENAPLLESRVCLYENSPDGHLILDRHPAMNNVWLVGGGSGHGFKLSPVVGEMTAQAIVSGKETPKQFRLERLRDATKPKTQFEGR
jgi:glycine/D-amino acid oxidase-like deaminating enzyme